MKAKDLKKAGLTGKKARKLLAAWVTELQCLRQAVGKLATCRRYREIYKTSKNVPPDGFFQDRLGRLRVYCPTCGLLKSLGLELP